MHRKRINSSMPQYVTNIENFWKEDLISHSYTRKTYFDSPNFNHLDRQYYNKDYLLQSFNEDLPCAEKFRTALDAKKSSVSWTNILPDVILPTHKDEFYTLRQTHDVSIDECYRYLVFLEDWTFGHLVGFDDKIISDWVAGDVWKFTGHEMHFGVNASNVCFHTAQISTFS